jgi:hypothetical protein
MNDKPGLVQQPERLSLKRWSRRKLEASRAQAAPARGPSTAPVAPVPAPPQAPQPAEQAAPNAPPALPPIESLTIDSEFAAFFKPEVPEATKRAALKQLFRDPRFNIMDGLDVYIDDYTQPDPIPAEMMKRLLHTRHIFNPPKTVINAEGHVVDVADQLEQVEPEEADAAAAIAAADSGAEVSSESLPRAADDSAEPDKIHETRPRGDTKS